MFSFYTYLKRMSAPLLLFSCVWIIEVSGLLLMLGQHTSHVLFFPLFLSDVSITNILVIDHVHQNFTHLFDRFVQKLLVCCCPSSDSVAGMLLTILISSQIFWTQITSVHRHPSPMLVLLICANAIASLLLHEWCCQEMPTIMCKDKVAMLGCKAWRWWWQKLVHMRMLKRWWW